jgi:transketolase
MALENMMAQYKDLDRKAIQLARQIVKMCTDAGSGHPSSALSILHITMALMYRVMRYDPKNPWNPYSDRLVLSEGHAVPAIYAAYCDIGGVVGAPERASELRFDDALTLRQADSVLDGHPNPAVGFPFFDAATGSLGQGISVAAGLACAARVDNSNRAIYCICGDGESREGQIWEALDFVVDQKLTNVRVIFNCNGQAQSDYVSAQQSAESLAKKLEAFGLATRIIDGHNWDEVFAALTAPATDRPIAIIAKTIKGWGVKELQKHTYHGKPLSSAQVPQAMLDLDAKAAELEVAAGADVSVAKIVQPPPGMRPPPGGPIQAGTFAAAMSSAGLADAIEKKTLSTRRAYGAALAALGSDSRVVAMDGDVKNSTFAEYFARKHPDRYFEASIAEQNMISAAVGLSAAGKVPFISTFAKFMVRGFDQMEMAAITNANLKMCGSHAGVSLAADGPSQMGLADLAFARALSRARRVDQAPACRVMLPSDAVSAFRLTEAMANATGLCYMRTHRPDVPFLYEEGESFPLGGFKHLVDGEDVLIVASGYMVHVAKQAIETLAEKSGLAAGLIDAYSLPLETEDILQIGDDCEGRIVVVEDNYIGGVADEITAAAARSDKGVFVETLYVRDIPKSAKTPQETLAMVHLAADDIAAACQRLFDAS